MKVAELEGALLDYWVARAAGLPNPRVDDGFCWIDEPACDGDPAGALDAAFAPSTDWATAGPIIEREGGAFEYYGPLEEGDTPNISAHMGHDAMTRGSMHGPTHLVAAMRAYVASRFGEEVPDEVQM
jgi:hypothetical protein